MTFTFCPKESRTYDFLHFAKMIYADFKKTIREEPELESVIDEDHEQLIEHIKKSLEPYRKTIEFYYLDDSFSKYDFVQLLIQAFPIEAHNEINDYVEHLSNQSAETIKHELLRAILKEEQEDEIADEAVEKALEQNEMEFVHGLDADPSFKWSLLVILEDPKRHLDRFVDLLLEIYPVFREIYDSYVDDVLSIGKRLEDALNSNPEEAIRRLTMGRIDHAIIKGREARLYVSAIFAYMLRVRDVGNVPIFIWGRRMEAAFERISRLNEDRIDHRVKLFKALGDRTRYEVLRSISRGASSLKDIAHSLGVSSATISYHTNEFIKAGAIRLDKGQRKLGYRIDYDLLESVIEEFKKDLSFPE
ncbi:MAG: ArsR/SmtB family transcription factor [Acholeplasmataceae bacterium]